MIETETLTKPPLARAEVPRTQSPNFFSDTVAALLSSSLYTTAFYPLHRVKTLLQTQDWHPSVQAGTTKRFTFTSSFFRLSKEQGVRSLWRGNMPYMLRHVPSTSLSFSLNETMHRYLPAHDPITQPALTVGASLLSGGVAGVVALAVVFPLDFATIRMAANLGPQDPGMMQTLTQSSRKGGVRELYRGFTVSAVAIGSYKALYFGLYDVARTYFLPSKRQRPQSTPQHAQTAIPHHSTGGSHAEGKREEMSGDQERGLPLAVPKRVMSKWQELCLSWAVASGVVWVATTVTYPLDIIRKRLVVDGASSERQFASFADCVWKVYRAEGVRGFYRFYGYDMLLRSGGGLLLVAYDEVRRLGFHV